MNLHKDELIEEVQNLKTGIVILNYNDFATTINLVKSIETYKSINNIVVVDNCSTDGSYAELLNRIGLAVDVIKSDKNGGYSYGNNFGAKYLLTQYNPEVIFIANPDVQFHEDYITNIIRMFEKSDYVALSGVMLHPDGTPANNSAWNIPTYWDDVRACFPILSRLWKKGRSFVVDYQKNVMDVEVLSGSLFGIRASAFIDIDFFDEGTFLYCEERILARKLQDKCYKVGLIPSVEFKHFHGKSTSKRFKSVEIRKLLYTSRLFYQVEYNKISTARKIFLSICMSLSLFEANIFYFIRDTIRIGK